MGDGYRAKQMGEEEKWVRDSGGVEREDKKTKRGNHGGEKQTRGRKENTTHERRTSREKREDEQFRGREAAAK